MLRSAEHARSLGATLKLLPSLTDIRDASVFLLLTLALVFGGGTKQGLWSDALIEVSALAVLGMAVWHLRLRELDTPARAGFLLCLIVMLIPLIQLAPLPPFIWQHLPGRSEIAEELSLVGLDRTWQPLTLAPRECWASLLSLIPAASLFVVTAQLGAERRQVLIRIFMIWICAGVGLSLMQIAGGPDSPFRFYADTNIDRAVGFFANANHNALALCLAVPFVILAPFASRERPGLVSALIAASILISIVVAVALTRSRAGLGLIFLAVLLGGALVLLRTEKGKHRKRYLLFAIGLGAVALVASFLTGFVGLSERFELPLAADLRWEVLRVSYNAALHFLPVGSGVGSFVPIYERFAPVTLVHLKYVNHAHDDWIELLIELGALLPIMVAAFALWVAFAIRDQWRKYGPKVLGKVASCIMVFLLMAIASAVDYPMRTIALMCVFGLTCGLLIEPPGKRVGRSADAA